VIGHMASSRIHIKNLSKLLKKAKRSYKQSVKQLSADLLREIDESISSDSQEIDGEDPHQNKRPKN